MRINQFVARAAGLSRRKADEYIDAGRVTIDGETARLGAIVGDGDLVCLDSSELTLKSTTTIMLNKPVGYVCSRDGQGSRTIYDLLPEAMHNLNPIGRLDKDSSGLLLMTNDGQLAQRLSHPKYQKQKIYQITLNKPLDNSGENSIKVGVELSDGISKFELYGSNKSWKIIMREGRNRQIRRTFEALGYQVTSLNRTELDGLKIGSLKQGQFIHLDNQTLDAH